MKQKGLPPIISPDDSWKWKYLISRMEEVLGLFNYKEIRLPVLQDSILLTKGITALLEPEEEKHINGQLLSLAQTEETAAKICLRPEGTINIIHYVAAGHSQNRIHRIFYHGPMFRRDSGNRPAEFYQLGVELLGSDSILSENEVISLGMKICDQLGLKDAWLEIGSFGCNACRPKYIKAMRQYLREQQANICESCYQALNRNPLQSSECLDQSCILTLRQGPRIQEHLCSKCKANFLRVKQIQANLGNNYKVNHNLIKNYAYYNETVFNFVLPATGRTEIIGGGGRYDYLSNQITKKQIPAVGFYFNLDLLYEILQRRHLFHDQAQPFKVYVCSQSKETEIILLQTVQELYQKGISTVISSDQADTETETSLALKNGCQAMVVLKSENLREGKVLLKNLMKDKQSYVLLSELLPEISLIRKTALRAT